MRPTSSLSTLISLLVRSSISLGFLAACSPHPNPMINPIDPEEFSFVAPETNPQLAPDPLRQQIGQFFLVEHFAVTIDASMIQAIHNHQPGGILFWNQNKVNAETLRSVISQYSQVAKSDAHAPILFSADYEGGGLSMSPSGASIPGIQRFTTGFTALAHPAWLGVSMPKYGTELCTLHGQIMARELTSVGLNYPLSVVSDLQMRLMRVRGISLSPDEISNCMNAMMIAFQQRTNIVMVTKHFPGLGQVDGDTHEGAAVSRARSLDETLIGVEPFKRTIQFVNGRGIAPIYSIMASHASYPFLDPQHITTESPAILNTLLKTQLGFRGIALSDAMWMGNYGSLGLNDLMVAYLNSFLSGMDMLMIPGSKFARSITYFRSVYDNNPSPQFKAAVEQQIGPWDATRARFLARMTESLTRIRATQAVLRHSVDSVDGANIVPSSLTVTERTRYNQILNDLDARFPAPTPSVPASGRH